MCCVYLLLHFVDCYPHPQALLDTTDEFIYRELTRGRETHTYYKG